MCVRTFTFLSESHVKSLKPTNKAPELSSGMPKSNLVNWSAPSKITLPFFWILDSNLFESRVWLSSASSVSTDTEMSTDEDVCSLLVLPQLYT